MNSVKVRAYAKLNLTLEIMGVQNGFHLLDSLVASVDLFDEIKAKKRNDGIEIVLDELSEVIGDGESDGRNLTDELTLKYTLNAFVGSLKRETREIFVRRYWYLSSIKEISRDYGISESKIKVTLLRTRELLRDFLRKEGIVI